MLREEGEGWGEASEDEVETGAVRETTGEAGTSSPAGMQNMSPRSRIESDSSPRTPSPNRRQACVHFFESTNDLVNASAAWLELLS